MNRGVARYGNASWPLHCATPCAGIRVREKLPHARGALSAARCGADRGARLADPDRHRAARRHRLPGVPACCGTRQDLPQLTTRAFEGDSAEAAAWLESGAADAGIVIDPPPAHLPLATD